MGKTDFEIKEGDRIAQLIIEKCTPTELKEMDNLDDTKTKIPIEEDKDLDQQENDTSASTMWKMGWIFRIYLNEYLPYFQIWHA